MKSIITFAAISLMALSSQAATSGSEQGGYSVAAADSTISQSNVIGTWSWVNNGLDYPVFFEFGNENRLKIMRMRPGNTDIDEYRWNMSGSTIFYTRPAADDHKINRLEIINIDSSTMLLKDGETDIWLERLQR